MIGSKADFALISNAEKALFINSLRPKYQLRELLDFFNIRKSSYLYAQKANLTPSKWAETDQKILEFLESHDEITYKKGYREVKNQLIMDGTPYPERRIRYVMKINGFQAWQNKSMKPYRSYKDDGRPAAPNYLYDSTTKTHFFHPSKPGEILGTDVSEVQINGQRVFLSVIIDFYDSSPLAWRIGRHPDVNLIVGTVCDLLKSGFVKEPFVLHMDRGSVNRSHAMRRICAENHILLSMSRKGKSGDNAPTEGFFGRLKQEWFHKIDFSGYDYEAFVASLNHQLEWHFNRRSSSKLGGISPAQFRGFEIHKVPA
jgi:transposase InsO family protein